MLSLSLQGETKSWKVQGYISGTCQAKCSVHKTAWFQETGGLLLECVTDLCVSNSSASSKEVEMKLNNEDLLECKQRYCILSYIGMGYW